MVNCNPETVSTDYDTSDRLYFEPLGEEEVLAVCEREQPDGVVIQFGGQTPLKLARALEEAGFPILGTPFDAVDLAEDRERFGALCDELGIRCPEWGSAADAGRGGRGRGADRLPGARAARRTSSAAARCGSATAPDDVREAMRGVQRAASSSTASSRTRSRSTSTRSATATTTYVAAVMEHVEEAGVHSGDSSCVLPPPSLDPATAAAVDDVVRRLAPALGVVGLVNVQLAVVDGEVYVLEANPRASRTVRSRARRSASTSSRPRAGSPAGARSRELDLPPSATPPQVSVKAAVLPFARFPGADPVLGPGDALDRRGDGDRAPTSRPRSRRPSAPPAGRCRRRHGVPLGARRATRPASSRSRPALAGLGFELLATGGTARALAAAGLEVAGAQGRRGATADGRRPDPPRPLRPRRQHARRASARTDGYLIREAALAARVPCITTISGRGGRGARDRERARRDRALAPGADDAEARTRLTSSRTRPSARTRCCGSTRGGSTPASRASSSCSRRPAGCCRGR